MTDAVEKAGDEFARGLLADSHPSPQGSQLCWGSGNADASNEHSTQLDTTHATSTQLTPTHRTQIPRCGADARCGWQGS